MQRIVAIINGDLIGSSALEQAQREKFHQWLGSLPDLLEGELAAGSPYFADTFRGDSWQLLVAGPDQVVRVALYIEAWLKTSFGPLQMLARMGIGIGAQELAVGFDLASADGPAFRRSGSALEASYRGGRLQLKGPQQLSGFPDDSFRVMLEFIDEITNNWTSKQAQAVMGALVGMTQNQIGRNWSEGPISQQAVGQHLDRAGWSALASSLEYFETWLPQVIEA